jgi:hypothetical protein
MEPERQPTKAPERVAPQPANETKRAAQPAKRPATRQKPTAPVEELGLLDRARRTVVSGNYQRALALLDRHNGLFPSSQFAEERQALRVRALEGAGLQKQAGQAASDFEAHYPSSVLAPQMNEGKRTPP